ncbi:B3/B4 domain-containing protein [Microbacter margulisiae]|uniref:DNA/RNA-binding domain of Phe-tRNA-synthetase-like protein n=1 Tax=Microbacter margulisiae TaxID=1350067 RepID=A0A7W5DP08_9PORP|nr:phenylalanine--tRNA ligase beta subunit-related protein [Microbacter margulisiae]MBB3186352.1 DNA/RNA-binding domain of Phe-tRNA-synthetase-like protein [Microbacter margulisiae]
MIPVSISDHVRTACPQLVLGLISCSVTNSTFEPGLWEEIHAAEEYVKARYTLEQINKIPAIQATRTAYKAFGKDPNRYRPSAEALCRRIVRGIPLYQINTLVDIINLISIRTGYSIGGFDADKIEGTLTLTVGTADDHFEGIGRGVLNIDGLPVYKDSKGGIGTPTSDNERTKISTGTTHLFLILNGYSGKEGVEEAVKMSVTLLEKYSHAVQIEEKLL